MLPSAPSLQHKTFSGKACTREAVYSHRYKQFYAIKLANCESTACSDAHSVTIENCTRGENVMGLSEVTPETRCPTSFPAMEVSQSNSLANNVLALMYPLLLTVVTAAFPLSFHMHSQIAHAGSCLQWASITVLMSWVVEVLFFFSLKTYQALQTSN